MGPSSNLFLGMALSPEARNRIFIATTDKQIGTEISDSIDAAAREDAVALPHSVVRAPSFSSSSPGKQPTPIVFGVTLGHAFTVNTSDGYYFLKIPNSFVNDGETFHIHWTKSSNVNEQGKAVRWRISYSVLDGETMNADITPTVVEVEDYLHRQRHYVPHHP